MDGSGKSWPELGRNVRAPSSRPTRVVDLDDDDEPGRSPSSSVFDEEDKPDDDFVSRSQKIGREATPRKHKQLGW